MIYNIKLWLGVSAVTMLLCLSIILGIRPLWGIDFTGGSLLEIETEKDSAVVRELLAQTLGLSATVQAGEAGSLLIRTAPLDEAQHQEAVRVLVEAGGLTEELRFESIGPTIGAELRRKSITALALVLAAIIAYLAYTFREMKGLVSSWKFGIAATYALLHDLLFVTALFVILGKTMGVTIDTLFVTAMLAILGYSVNDTIVIFDRFRTDWISNRKGRLLDVLDGAARASRGRSLQTSGTTLLVLFALLFFGGTTIHWFIVALAAGTIVGTYSSLFVAPPLLHYLAKR
jgi:preprotein translocase SecF subunit